jgi:peptide deformylase
MILKILQTGEPVLRQTAQSLSAEEINSPYIQTLIQLMQNTLHDVPGVGLAAPQVGVSLQLIVIEDRPEYTQSLSPQFVAERERLPVPFHVIINPSIILDQAPRAKFFEGCLSATGLISLVPRAKTVRVDCLNEKAEPMVIEASGWYARILQHEIDHLQGALCIDHMYNRSLMSIENYRKYWHDKPITQICAELGIK